MTPRSAIHTILALGLISIGFILAPALAQQPAAERSGASLAGTVETPDGEAPGDAVSVTLVGYPAEPPWIDPGNRAEERVRDQLRQTGGFQETTTDAVGRFQFDGIPRGSYWIYATAGDSMALSRSFGLSGPARIELDTPLVLREAVVPKVRITPATAPGARPWKITLIAQRYQIGGNLVSVGDGRTDEDGRWSGPALPVRSYEVEVEDIFGNDYAVETIELSTDRRATKIVLDVEAAQARIEAETAEAHAPAAEMDERIARRQQTRSNEEELRRLTFRVLANGQPVSGVRIVPRASGWLRPSHHLFSDENGRVELHASPHLRELDLIAMLAGRRLTRETFPVSNDEALLHLSDEPGGTLVVRHPGRRVETMSVEHDGLDRYRLTTLRTWSITQLVTLEDAQLTVPAMAPGRYRLCDNRTDDCVEGTLEAAGELVLALPED